jgi:branched-chain amino acid transport system substrate-binding protein
MGSPRTKLDNTFLMRKEEPKMRRLIIAILAIMLVIGLSNYVEAQVFKIGAVYPFTGSLAVYAEDGKRGIEIAVDELNSAGGIHGKKIEVIYENCMGTPSGAVSAVQKLITVDKVPAIVGTLFASFTMASAPIADRNKTVLIAPMSSHQKFSDWQYIFRVTPSTDFQARIMGEYAYKVLGLRKIASLFYTTDTGYAWDAGLTERFQKLGGSVVIHETYPQGSTDFRTALTKIRATNPEAISVYGTWREIATQVKQMKELKIETKVLNCSQVEEPALIQFLGKDADGIIYAIQAPPTTEASKKVFEGFLNKFKSKFNRDPGIVAKTSYDCVKIVAQAAIKGGGTGEEIQKEMAKLKNFPGVDGELSYDENRHPIKKITIKVIRDEKFVQTGFESTGE